MTGASVKVRGIEVDRLRCKGCGICIEFCPREVLEADEQGKPNVVAIERCTACRLCELRCPDFAIWLRGANDE